MTENTFNFNNFVKESKEVLLNPKAFFAGFKTEGGLGEPVIKALLYGTLSGIFALLWSLLKIGGITGGLFGGAIGIMALIWSVIGALIGLFIGAVVILILSAITGGKTDFEPCIRVTASLMVLMPINSFFGFLSFSPVLNSIISLLINLYGLYMLYHALTQSLAGKENSAKILSYVLLALLAILFIVGLTAKRAANNVFNKFENEYEETLKDYEKEMKKAAKQLEDAAEEMLEDMEEDSE